MAEIINIDGKEITIGGFNVTLLDNELGENVTYTLKRFSGDVDSNNISIEFGRTLITSNGYQIPLDGSGNYQLDLDVISLISDSLVKAFINVLFKDALKNQGIEAEQIYNENGEIEVIKKVRIWEVGILAMKDVLYIFEGKTYRCLIEHKTELSLIPTKAKTYWIEEKI